MNKLHRTSVILLILGNCVSPGWGAAKVRVEAPYVFTDEKAVLVIDPVPATKVGYTVKTITVDGWGPQAQGEAAVENGAVRLAPLAEGIHIVTLDLAPSVEVRFLGMAPPAAAQQPAALATLPRSGRKLFSQEPYTVLSMGDSVTATGDYEGMLVRLLQRATGNPNIRFVDHSYAGRSVDASVRTFADDTKAPKPDVGLLMYGLNDQGGGCPLAGYLEQYRWIAEHLAADCGADAVFLTPTPDFSRDAAATGYSPYVFRTIGFAASLAPLAASLHVPLADTFNALWGNGGPTLDAAAQARWPLFPLGYSQQLSAQLESNGNGDGIHPNALGHLQIAKCAFAAMLGLKPVAAPLAFNAVSEWNATGLVTQVTVRSSGQAVRHGTLEVYPVASDVTAVGLPETYAIAEGRPLTFALLWPKLKDAAALLQYPACLYHEAGPLYFAVVDRSSSGSRVYAVPAPMAVAADFVRERRIVTGGTATASLRVGAQVEPVSVRLPAGAEVGRIPLVRQVTLDGKTGWAAAELAFVRFGQARAGEAIVDGDLRDWAEPAWAPVGEPAQARWTQGPADLRASPQDGYLRWAFKAGAKGLYLAVKATGDISRDHFTLFFDPREPQLLGTPGRYYWVSGTIVPEKQQVTLSRGETTPTDTGLTGALKLEARGATLELFVPYATFDLTAWPAAGDLGLSIWWVHSDAEGKTTHLMWAEDGHPWNPRWYGVVRLVTDPAAALPYRVRIR